MNRAATIFLRIAAALAGLLVLALCIFVLPAALMSTNVGGYRPIIIGMYLSAVPFYVGLYLGFRLLHLVDAGQAFSRASQAAVRHIKWAAGSIALVYTLGLPYIFYVADQDDAPGVVLFGFMIAAAASTVSLVAALLEKVFASARQIKSENDLTV